MAFSISMAVSASRLLGPPSLLDLPPGILPTPDKGSLYSICGKRQARSDQVCKEGLHTTAVHRTDSWEQIMELTSLHPRP